MKTENKLNNHHDVLKHNNFFKIVILKADMQKLLKRQDGYRLNDNLSLSNQGKLENREKTWKTET